MGDHPTIDELQSFLADRCGNRDLNRRVVRHLLAGCSSCRECLQALGASRRLTALVRQPGEPHATGEPDPGYDAALARAEESFSLFLSGGRPVQEPPGSLLAQLAPLPGLGAARRGSSIPLLIRWLVARSHAARFDDPEAMQRWALMARLAAESCSAEEAGSAPRLADLRARAWAQLGNSLRVKGAFRVADEALRVAEDHLARGTGDLSLRSWFLAMSAALRFDQRRYREAAEIAGQAAQISSGIEEHPEEARRLLTQANAWNRAGDTEQAAHLLQTALRRPEFRKDTWWRFIARHNLTECHIDAGQERQALALTLANSRTRRQPTGPLLLLRAQWQQGELLARMGHTEAAEATLQRAYRGFLAKQMPQQIAWLCREIVILNRQMQCHERADRALNLGIQTLQSLRAEPEHLAVLTELGGAA